MKRFICLLAALLLAGPGIALADKDNDDGGKKKFKDVNAGECVGYGLTYRASRPMKLVVLPIGYYDGYDRKLSNCGRVLIKGQPASVVGRVAMNMTMVDVTDTGAGIDDEVVLLGRQGNSEIRVEELAERTGSIPWEVLSRINPLIPRMAV